MFILGPYIGVGMGEISQGVPWTPGNLFPPGTPGYWSGGAEPPMFTPAGLFGEGFWAGGYEPEPFSPVLLFATDTPGYYAGQIEVTP